MSSVVCRPYQLSKAMQPLVPHLQYNAHELATAYAFPAYTPSSVAVIGVLSFGGGLFGHLDAATGILTNGDVQRYWGEVCGVADADMPTVVVKPLLGATNDVTDTGGTVENTLDVTMIGACRPGAGTTIILYLVPNGQGLTTAFRLLFSTPVEVKPAGVLVIPKLFSVSWGHDETAILKAEATACDAVLAAATARGTNVCVASGDSGSNNGLCDWPAASPHVTACGGTTLYCPSASRRYDDAATVEYAWTGGGGGVSAYFSTPAYQSSSVLRRRCVPDVALNADVRTGVRILVNGVMEVMGGTSAAAPLFAAYLARASQPPAFVNPTLYGASRAAFHDVLIGSNGLYNCSAGYDLCTGMGSINGAVLTSEISNAGTGLAIIEPIVGLVVGTSVNLTAASPASSTSSASDVTALIWQSSNPSILSVSARSTIGRTIPGPTTSAATVIVTALAVGTATISVTVPSISQTASRVIVVSRAAAPAMPVTPVTPVIPVRSLSVSTESVKLTLRSGGAPSPIKKLSVRVLPTNATNKTVSWMSQNSRVASVTSLGELTGLRVGRTVVTVASEGVTAAVVVTVASAPVPTSRRIFAQLQQYAGAARR